MTKAVVFFVRAKIFYAAAEMQSNWKNHLRKKETDLIMTKTKTLSVETESVALVAALTTAV